MNKIKTLIAVAILTPLAGCSYLPDMPDFFGEEEKETLVTFKQSDATEGTLASPLEIPPELTIPSNYSQDLDLSAVIAQKFEFNDDKKQLRSEIQLIKVKGVEQKSNDRQRWLEIEMDVQTLWVSLQDYLAALDYDIESQDPQLGQILTKYRSRGALVPKEQQNFLNRYLNPMEINATGWLDQYSFKIEEISSNKYRVLVSHQSMQEIEDADGNPEWIVREGSVEKESLMLANFTRYLGQKQESK